MTGPGWAEAPGAVAVMDALAEEDAAPRFVGGCVRDHLAGWPIKDIDIATPLRPERVMEKLCAAGITAAPTGLDHGTVTAVYDGQPFEITTLRIDVETDGRHATVAFTADWRADAARRDFTINALSLGRDGAMYDYFGGAKDLEDGRIRFVGDADTRIAEDRLRVLRFYRFHAGYGRIGARPTEADPVARAACRRVAGDLHRLAAERIGSEMRRLLVMPEPASTLRLMLEDGVLPAILPGVSGLAAGVARLAALVTLEGVTLGADPMRRLAALLGVGGPDAAANASAATPSLTLRRAERDRLKDLVRVEDLISPDLPGPRWRGQRYRLGLPIFHDLALLAWAGALEGEAQVERFETERWCALIRQSGDWTPPVFPLRGQDTVEAGVPAGPKRGALLRTVEDWWIAQDFAPGRAACLERLGALWTADDTAA